MGTIITFKRPDGKEASGYLANAARGDAPGVVVIQEWWGLQDQIKGMCDRFARAGFDALAPDLYRGVVVPYHDTDAANKQMTSLDFMDATTQSVRGAVQYLSRNGARVGLTGFCMGGALSLLSSTMVPELDAVVCWYGIPPLDFIDAAKIKAPLLGHFAMKDAFFNIKNVDALEQKLQQAGVPHEFYRYDAMHAFANETAINMPIPIKYDQPSADLAWQRTLDFLKRVLH